jgi:RNA polymerase sigma factor (sigma-70 family)
MSDDSSLLQEHVERGSDEAFRVLVERHSGMVYGTALRLIRQPQLAEEITQAVFILLARKAARLQPGTILAGWLYRTTHFVAREAVRAEHRRQHHQQRLVEINPPSDSASTWDCLAPHLDEAMQRLRTGDRDAVVLRFLQDRSFAEVGGALGISEAAAKMRVGRALEKLRSALGPRGIALSATALAAALSAHAATAAPAGLLQLVFGSVSAARRGAVTSASSWVTHIMKIMAWNKVKNGLVAGAIALLLLLSAYVVGQQKGLPPQPAVARVANFEPMAGEWEGTFASHTAGGEMASQPVTLSIRTTEQGRRCEIEMRLKGTVGGDNVIFLFTHTLNEAGDHIVTVDDPHIGVEPMDGMVTESIDDRRAGEWRAGFRADRPERGGFTECRWVCRKDELSITRQDVTGSPQRPETLTSNLQLRRRLGAQAR